MIWKVLFFSLVLLHLSWGQDECAGFPRLAPEMGSKCVGGGDAGLQTCSSISDDLDAQLESVKEEMKQQTADNQQFSAMLNFARTQWCNESIVQTTTIGSGVPTCLEQIVKPLRWTWNCLGTPIYVVTLYPHIKCLNPQESCCGECSKCQETFRKVLVLAVTFRPGKPIVLTLTWICNVPFGCSCHQYPCMCQA